LTDDALTRSVVLAFSRLPCAHACVFVAGSAPVSDAMGAVALRASRLAHDVIERATYETAASLADLSTVLARP
jgi:hypothetical protein